MLNGASEGRHGRVVVGGPGPDELVGGPGRDILRGDTEDTVIDGRGGVDTARVVGTDGADDLAVGRNIAVDDPGLYVFGDGLRGGKRVRIENVERLEVFGGGGDDHLVVSDLVYGIDEIAVLGGSITVTGVDLVTFYGGRGDDTLDATVADGPVVALGGLGDDRLTGGAFADRLVGGQGGDTLQGGGRADRLWGQEHRDTLDGGGGDDELNGGHGDDRLAGGAGSDSFEFSSGLVGGARDTIIDFKDDVDMIVLDGASLRVTSRADALSHATVVDGNTVFNFGGSNALIVKNIADPDLLRDDLAIVDDLGPV
jgi:Ca2+-binding RTX toxin-like protein